MYQPKIREELISRLYHLAKARGVHMTTLVNRLLEAALDNQEPTDTKLRGWRDKNQPQAKQQGE